MPKEDTVPGAEDNIDKEVQTRFFPDQCSGVLVEVGAAHPEYLSISALYRDLGWNVVSIEPNPKFCELHRAHGHEVLQYACGDHDEDDVEFSVVDSQGTPYSGGQVSFEAWSSLAIKDSYAALADSDLSINKIKVKLRRLDTLLREYAPTVDRIDILSVDVEGWELEVLDGVDMVKFRPRVLIIENLFADRRYRVYMRSKGYVLWKRIEPNDVYVMPSDLRFRDRVNRNLSYVRVNTEARLKRLKPKFTDRALSGSPKPN
ncbi:MAG TPA: FkbM family methyltransferase [Solirubrobacteraceae bacterium]|jgi:FkbM family methyltransferase|nr:FkbM family methyltransferase [Solirubrobacteraceae bacterium]